MTKIKDISLSDELFAYKQLLLTKLIDGLDDGSLGIKNVDDRPYVSYEAVLDLVTNTKIE